MTKTNDVSPVAMLRSQARATLDLPPPAKCQAIREAAWRVPRETGHGSRCQRSLRRLLRAWVADAAGENRIRYVAALTALREEMTR